MSEEEDHDRGNWTSKDIRVYLLDKVSCTYVYDDVFRMREFSRHIQGIGQGYKDSFVWTEGERDQREKRRVADPPWF